MKEEVIVVDGLHINYREAGSGKPILILHGWGRGSVTWIAVQDFLAQKGCRVIVPDFPGFGKSDVPQRAWTVDDYVMFVEHFIAQMQLANFFIVGHSFGGRLCIKMPKNGVRGLVLMSAAGIKHAQGFEQRLLKNIARIGASFENVPFFPYVKKVFYHFFVGKNDYSRLEGIMKETFKKVIDEDLTPYLSAIAVPTLIVWGRKDRITPISDAFRMHEEIKDSTLKILDKGTHILNIEMPEELAYIIDEFFKGV